MPHKPAGRPEPATLRKETRDWLTNKTIPNVRQIAQELANAGEDVHDLLAAIHELEELVREGSAKDTRRRAMAGA